MKVFVFLLVLFSLPALAAIEAYPFPNEELRTRYNQLIDELRCPQCLNTNLAGSDAMKIASGISSDLVFMAQHSPVHPGP